MTLELVNKEDIKIGKIIEHHVKYLEIHGEDKTVFITLSEHKLLHNRLRKEGKCKIPAEKLAKISSKAYQRTDKCKNKIDSKEDVKEKKDNKNTCKIENNGNVKYVVRRKGLFDMIEDIERHDKKIH
jgi:hypothetical protein